jgi:sulfur relay (sulfurtransferase) DsrF/TusC family protein
MTSVLFVLNDGPHGSERSYNALVLPKGAADDR